MCDTALCFARDHLLPLARDHLLPVLTEAANMIRGVPKEVAELKDELESIEDFINDADRMAKAEEDNTRHRIKAKIKQLREASFRIEDVIDEYTICEEQQPRDPGCAGADLVKTMILRLQIAYKIQNIKSRIREMKDTSGTNHGFQIQSSSEQGPSSSIANKKATLLQNLREAPFYMEEDDVVGFEAPNAELIDWLVKGRLERTVISVVGMGGMGKTTLAKKVFDSKEVIGHFDCRVWITLSQSYTAEGLLRNMLLRIYKQKGDDPPQGISEMDRRSLVDEVRNYLQQKRYVVVFDDVWSPQFWDEIEFAVIDNKNGSKILVTTRNMDVAMSCKKSSFVEVHKLQPLTEKQSLELFNKKTFRFDLDGCCPKELIDISSEIVKKCKGLPLGIVAIGGLLSTKEKIAFEWQRFSENLSLELTKYSHLIGIKEILTFSYDNLPYYLKACLLYFGIYPEDYVVNSKRLVRQWIAEGFVKAERGKTLEKVAEGYLTELINRSLVQISSIEIDGKAKSCRVHDLIRVMIHEQFEDLSFCRHIGEDGQSSFGGIIRRLSIATISNDLMANIESSHVRSLLMFTNDGLLDDFVSRISTKYMLLKVLDFEDVSRGYVPKKLGNLIHLKYLSLKNNRKIKGLPKSIGMLQNLETFDVSGTNVREMPKEISKLRKLRHLVGDEMSLIQLKDGIGGMTSLQTLRNIFLDVDGVVELIKELGKLKHLTNLGLVGVRGEHGKDLSSSINEMQHLEILYIESKSTYEVIDLHLISSLPMLRKLDLFVKLGKLPKWIAKLQNLVKLRLRYSQLTDDPIKSLKNMQNLLSLSITNNAYEGESLQFQDGGFQKLKELYLGNSDNLNSMVIDKGALNSLKKLHLWDIPQLKKVPYGIQYLEKLQDLGVWDWDVPTEFVNNIQGKLHRIEHLPNAGELSQEQLRSVVNILLSRLA